MRTPQEIKELISNRLQQMKISANKMLLDCGYNTSLLTDMKRGQMPSADKIAAIASYLGVSTDYLLGNKISAPSANAEETQNMIKLFVETGVLPANYSNDDLKRIADFVVDSKAILDKLKGNNK